MKNILKIISHSSLMLDDPEKKNVISEAIFGERIEILKKLNNWALIKLLNDNYKGWIDSQNIGLLPKSNYKIIVLRSFIKKYPNVKSEDIDYLTFGSEIYVETFENGWAKIKLTSFHLQNFGYIYRKDIEKILNFKNDWVEVAKNFVNTPYRWGGRTSLGLDCSALLQTALKSIGLFIPRDTKDQIVCDYLEGISCEEINRGTIIFWKGHVGIMLDEYTLIHANGFHMKVKIEPFTDICLRMKDERILAYKKIKEIKL